MSKINTIALRPTALDLRRCVDDYCPDNPGGLLTFPPTEDQKRTLPKRSPYESLASRFYGQHAWLSRSSCAEYGDVLTVQYTEENGEKYPYVRRREIPLPQDICEWFHAWRLSLVSIVAGGPGSVAREAAKAAPNAPPLKLPVFRSVYRAVLIDSALVWSRIPSDARDARQVDTIDIMESRRTLAEYGFDRDLLPLPSGHADRVMPVIVSGSESGSYEDAIRNGKDVLNAAMLALGQDRALRRQRRQRLGKQERLDPSDPDWPGDLLRMDEFAVDWAGPDSTVHWDGSLGSDQSRLGPWRRESLDSDRKKLRDQQDREQEQRAHFRRSKMGGARQAGEAGEAGEA